MDLDDNEQLDRKSAVIKYVMKELLDSSSSNESDENNDDLDIWLSIAGVLCSEEIDKCKEIDKSQEMDKSEAIKIDTVPQNTNFKSNYYYYVEHVVENYTNDQFKANFLLPRHVCADLTTKFLASKQCPPNKLHGGRRAFPPKYYILVFIWFAVNKSNLKAVGTQFGIRISCVHRVVGVAIEFLTEYSPNVIYFPKNSAEKISLADKMWEKIGVPDVLGCIDSTIIELHGPNITLQAICDVDMRFLDVFVGDEGQIDGSIVYFVSPISDNLEELCEDRFHIFGSNAYNIREWLITPFRSDEHLEQGTHKFNRKIHETRVLIKKAFGILKKRFPQLNRMLMQGGDRLYKFIISCCVLHNLSIDGDVSDDEVVDFADDNEVQTIADHTPREMVLRKQGEDKRFLMCKSLL